MFGTLKRCSSSEIQTILGDPPTPLFRLQLSATQAQHKVSHGVFEEGRDRGMEPIGLALTLLQTLNPLKWVQWQERWQGGKSLNVRMGYKLLPRIDQGTRIEIYINVDNTSKRRIDLTVIKCDVWTCGRDGLNPDNWDGVYLNKYAPVTKVWLEPGETHTERYWIIVQSPHRFMRIWASTGTRQNRFLCFGTKAIYWQYHDVFDVGNMVEEA